MIRLWWRAVCYKAGTHLDLESALAVYLFAYFFLSCPNKHLNNHVLSGFSFEFANTPYPRTITLRSCAHVYYCK
jgi:hypothetical protein